MRRLLIVIVLAILAFCAWAFFVKCDRKMSCTLADVFSGGQPPAITPETTAENTPEPPTPETPAPTTPAPTTPPDTPIEAQPEQPVAPPPTPAPTVSSNAFAFEPPGALPPGTGNGIASSTIYVTGMRYPLEKAPSFLNSQVYGHGGLNQPGSQCDAVNYSYPWRDNFCETRTRSTAMCPAGKGHQGQDIRAATCGNAHLHSAVAAEPGKITYIGEYTVTLTADSGVFYRYLHMQMDDLKVTLGDRVARGQQLGWVSNNFGNTVTTFHLHFEIKAPVALADGSSQIRFVPPYATLIDSYKRLLQGTP
jgi:murein DD-endopeptidase MepM/ murein hydrolase activator NlpD